jgi:hypothetical protein
MKRARGTQKERIFFKFTKEMQQNAAENCLIIDGAKKAE